jgi:hypothetical protein
VWAAIDVALAGLEGASAVELRLHRDVVVRAIVDQLARRGLPSDSTIRSAQTTCANFGSVLEHLAVCIASDCGIEVAIAATSTGTEPPMPKAGDRKIRTFSFKHYKSNIYELLTGTMSATWLFI